MTLVIGTDEAGYGPNLGPLVVAATVWDVAAAPDDADAALAAALESAALAADPSAASAAPLWADSKTVYRGGAASGMAALELAAMSGIAVATGRVPAGWDACASALHIQQPDGMPPPEWATLASSSLPIAIDAATCESRAGRIATALADAGAAIRRVACRVVHPREFNRLLDDGLNKSDILSQVTLGLAADAWSRTTCDGPAVIWCDRHGGRKSYAAVVSRHFACPLVRPLEETPARSAYELPEMKCRIEFCVGGERRGPVALASLAAKYVRELSMQAFNTFWGARSPGLAPTAGYPVDAARWRRDAAAAIAAAGIHDDDLWRRV